MERRSRAPGSCAPPVRVSGIVLGGVHQLRTRRAVVGRHHGAPGCRTRNRLGREGSEGASRLRQARREVCETIFRVAVQWLLYPPGQFAAGEAEGLLGYIPAGPELAELILSQLADDIMLLQLRPFLGELKLPPACGRLCFPPNGGSTCASKASGRAQSPRGTNITCISCGGILFAPRRSLQPLTAQMGSPEASAPAPSGHVVPNTQPSANID